MMLEDSQYSILFTANSMVLLTDGSWVPQGQSSVVPRTDDRIAKFYAHWLAVAEDIAVTAGDQFLATSTRVNALRGTL